MSTWVSMALAGFTFVLCGLRLFLVPNTPILAWGDALGYATKGVRILDGEWPYKDFFEFVTPGTDLVYALLFHWMGICLWIPNLLMCCMAAMAVFLVSWFSTRLLSASLALLPGLCTTGFIFSSSLDPTHHWFSTLCTLGATAALFDDLSARRILIAGGLSGLAASFTQSTGAAVVLAVLAFLWFQSRELVGEKLWRRRALGLIAAAVIVFAVLNGPFIMVAGLQRWLAEVIVFPIRYFGTALANNWHGTIAEVAERKGLVKWVSIPFLYAAVPGTYVWTLVKHWQRPMGESDKCWNQVRLLTCVGVGMLLAVASGPNLRRVSCASLPAVILFIWLLGRQTKPWQTAVRGLAAASVALALTRGVALQFHHEDLVALPAGSVAILDAGNAEVYRWMAGHTRPGQWYFGMPPYTLPLKLRNPTPIEAPTPGEYGRPEQIAAAVEGLERRRTDVLLLRPVLYLRDEVDHLRPFRNYLFKHYRLLKTFSTGDEVWERIREESAGLPRSVGK
jgi:hypothetical protein